MTNIFDELYDKFGTNISLKVLSEKPNKAVYELKTKNDEFILIVIKDVSPVKFYKYMHSLYIQQKLYKAGMNVAEIIYTYFRDKTIVSVHQKVTGEKGFPRNAESMEIIGSLVGKLHRISSQKIYSSTKTLLTYPNIFVRIGMLMRNLFTKTLPYKHKHLSAHNLPCGICHRDINDTNILLDKNNNAWLLDFDKNRYMPFVEGIVYFYHKHLKDKSLFPAFMKGYTKERPLRESEIQYLSQKLKAAKGIFKTAK